MATFATYDWMVDFNANGTFGDANEDITADVLRSEWRMGRDYASQLTGKSRGGRMILNLDNHTNAGKYNSFNTASAIYGSILPGRKVRLRATDGTGTVTLWQGFLDRINPQVPVGAARLALFEAVGPLIFVGQPWNDVFLEMVTNELTGTVVNGLLDMVDWPAGDRDVDAGKSTIRRRRFGGPQARVSVLDSLHRIEETENGFLHESLDGKVIFEDRDRRLKAPYTVSQVTVSDAPGAGEIVYSKITQGDPLKQIFNLFQTTIQLDTVGAVQVLWTMFVDATDTYVILPGQTRQVIAAFAADEDVITGVNAWTTPVATTDYTANSLADGTGTDLTASIGVAVTKLANRMEINLTNNHASLPAFITFLQARGTPITRRNPVLVLAQDATSIGKYGRRIWPIPAELVRDSQEGEDWVNWLLSQYKDPRPVLSVTIWANRDATHLSHVLRRKVSDRITIVASGSNTQLGINQDFFIETVHHTIDQNHLHWVTWECSGIPGSGGFPFWTLGVGQLGITTGLHY